MWMVVNCKNGISSYEIHRALGDHTEVRMVYASSHPPALQDGTGSKLGGTERRQSKSTKLSSAARLGNMHKSKRQQMRAITATLDDWTHEQNHRHGFLDRRDAAESAPPLFPNVKRDTLQDEILKKSSTAPRVYTDALQSAINGLDANSIVHEVVNHMEEYVRGQVHTNGIENFWSLLETRTARHLRCG